MTHTSSTSSSRRSRSTSATPTARGSNCSPTRSARCTARRFSDLASAAAETRGRRRFPGNAGCRGRRDVQSDEEQVEGAVPQVAWCVPVRAPGWSSMCSSNSDSSLQVNPARSRSAWVASSTRRSSRSAVCSAVARGSSVEVKVQPNRTVRASRSAARTDRRTTRARRMGPMAHSPTWWNRQRLRPLRLRRGSG